VKPDSSAVSQHGLDGSNQLQLNATGKHSVEGGEAQPLPCAGVTKFVSQSLAGFLLQKELDYLDGAVKEPKRPFAAIVGGSKVIPTINPTPLPPARFCGAIQESLWTPSCKL